MIRFNCDYGEGAHPKILERLAETNFEQTPGYGEDIYCERAAEKIRELCGDASLAVHFLVGGTQTNSTVITAALRPHQCALGAGSAHINVHETGAIEAGGHKVCVIPSNDGKISAEDVRRTVEAHWNDETHEHITQPKLVYIAQPTELGTPYSRAEIAALRDVCLEKNLLFYVDGARLGYGIAARGNDVDLPFLASHCDAFYIGGTKVGALFGEALVISNSALREDFRYIMKQRGALLAKGRLLGIQFLALLENGLYFEISRHAVRLAEKLENGFVAAGFPLFINSPTNQIFPILPDALLKKLSEKYTWSYLSRVDETHSAVRFCTDWATTEAQVDALLADIAALAK